MKDIDPKTFGGDQPGSYSLEEAGDRPVDTMRRQEEFIVGELGEERWRRQEKAVEDYIRALWRATTAMGRFAEIVERAAEMLDIEDSPEAEVAP